LQIYGVQRETNSFKKFVSSKWEMKKENVDAAAKKQRMEVLSWVKAHLQQFNFYRY